MADSKHVEIDPVMEKPFQRAKRLERMDWFKKSAYPPMEIEPVPLERNRLSGEGLTPELRALRKQWVNDQVLHHDARQVPELQPCNIFRKLYKKPADLIFYKLVKAIFGTETASAVRTTVPKLLMLFGASYFVWYHLKYHRMDWTRNGGVYIYQAKPTLLCAEAQNVPDKDKTDFFDQGFKSRKVLLYGHTSSSARPCH
ncbi:uncharacterized protein LOC131944424 [Physella acuta]|uniref:uncharacterized protein LOC131944424 n=1 Tax=Physella acuta TaxID=109671 RepID=UPI0027DB7B67|nr:uncharacterized protein LOC131944424 [Physella acuta]